MAESIKVDADKFKAAIRKLLAASPEPMKTIPPKRAKAAKGKPTRQTTTDR